MIKSYMPKMDWIGLIAVKTGKPDVLVSDDHGIFAYIRSYDNISGSGT